MKQSVRQKAQWLTAAVTQEVKLNSMQMWQEEVKEKNLSRKVNLNTMVVCHWTTKQTCNRILKVCLKTDRKLKRGRIFVSSFINNKQPRARAKFVWLSKQSLPDLLPNNLKCQDWASPFFVVVFMI